MRDAKRSWIFIVTALAAAHPAWSAEPSDREVAQQDRID